MFLASLGPVLRTPTLLYLAGVPGALKPWNCSSLTSTFGPRAAPAGGASAATASATAATINRSLLAVALTRVPPRGSRRSLGQRPGRRERRGGRPPPSPTGLTAGGRRARPVT